jgi:hypothetical protein
MSNLTVTRISFALALSLLILLAIQGSSVLDTQAFERKFLLYPILVIVSVVILMRLRGSRFSLESERQFSFALSDAIGLQIIPTGCFLYSVVVVNHTHSYAHAYWGVAVLSAQVGWTLYTLVRLQWAGS